MHLERCSVSNHELLHLRAHPAAVVLDQVDGRTEEQTTFSGKENKTSFSWQTSRTDCLSGHFQYQLQTGVVLAYDKTGRVVWSSAINAPIAAVWELKDGQLQERSLFDVTTTSYIPPADLSKDNGRR